MLADGQAARLVGLGIPNVRLQTSDAEVVDLADLASCRLVLFIFPSISRPGVVPAPGWSPIPGAQGCTQESCTYRDFLGEFDRRGFRVAGLSIQPPEDLAEAARRLSLGYPLLADPDRRVGSALELPTFTVRRKTFYKRLTLIALGDRIAGTFYPVLSPSLNPQEVLEWIDQLPPARLACCE